jgi:hypothetical protein
MRVDHPWLNNLLKTLIPPNIIVLGIRLQHMRWGTHQHSDLSNIKTKRSFSKSKSDCLYLQPSATPPAMQAIEWTCISPAKDWVPSHGLQGLAWFDLLPHLHLAFFPVSSPVTLARCQFLSSCQRTSVLFLVFPIFHFWVPTYPSNSISMIPCGGNLSWHLKRSISLIIFQFNLGLAWWLTSVTSAT